jgi:hypothetical protein
MALSVDIQTDVPGTVYLVDSKCLYEQHTNLKYEKEV